MITNITIEKLHPHPDNPRKELGDLTELAASIKEQGVFQNLTVIPKINELTLEVEEPSSISVREYEQEYTVIIGHRRLAAAKEAGLTELPCAVVDMDYPTQLSTMLLENMQRQDLTIMEQAEGIQLLLDLGESVKSVSTKTGLSEATIYKRKKLTELDKEEAQAALERGATLMDFAELEKIENSEAKNKLMKHMGTGNFKYYLNDAVLSQKTDKIEKELIESINDCIEKQMSVWFGVELSRLRYNICLYNEFGDLLMGV